MTVKDVAELYYSSARMFRKQRQCMSCCDFLHIAAAISEAKVKGTSVTYSYSVAQDDACVCDKPTGSASSYGHWYREQATIRDKRAKRDPCDHEDR